ncbi:MAG: hypothetical protein EPN73_14535 [Paraburkholderia sp.]|uniref:hypothetical protein n=1 Tax=Paraburkholderia sp. TaxID=1926495 RepID=UPI0011FCA2D3|nr:hypothetical protein [Paraburkholderia sp.]TAL95180.1 MAG: hypothetical protein EPN73_14535 [Paraburkholderia sp.]
MWDENGGKAQCRETQLAACWGAYQSRALAAVRGLLAILRRWTEARGAVLADVVAVSFAKFQLLCLNFDK